jgi:hypothetical protein
VTSQLTCHLFGWYLVSEDCSGVGSLRPQHTFNETCDPPRFLYRRVVALRSSGKRDIHQRASHRHMRPWYRRERRLQLSGLPGWHRNDSPKYVIISRFCLSTQRLVVFHFFRRIQAVMSHLGLQCTLSKVCPWAPLPLKHLPQLRWCASLLRQSMPKVIIDITLWIVGESTTDFALPSPLSRSARAECGTSTAYTRFVAPDLRQQ